MGCVVILVLAVVFSVFVSLLPALIIFLVLDRYRPGAYTPQNRGLRMVVYFVLIYVIQHLLMLKHLHTPWLLEKIITWGLPVPVYLFVRIIFNGGWR